jgi:phage terminase large subunit GpA-like protein
MLDSLSNASYRYHVSRWLAQDFAPWSKMPPEAWATEVYRLPKGGRFSWDYAPYSREMFRSIWDRRNISTSFRLFSRGLKSTVVLLSIGYIMEQAPRDILSLWPSNDNAELWSKDNLCGELLDCVPSLHYLGTKAKKRITANTLLHKKFFGGKIQIFGANAPGDMRRAKGSFLYGDEIDAIKKTETDEGDQLMIFEKRGDEFFDTIRVFASYPSVKGHSRIDARIEESDFCEWYSTCVLCGGEPFVMHRSQLRYDKGNTATARLECPRCKELLTDAQRYDMAHRQGFENWKPRNEFKGKRGFHASSLMWPHLVDPVKYPGGYLQILAEKELAAETSENPKRSKQVLVNTEDAESIDPTGEIEKPPDWQILFERREKYKEVPLAAKVVTCFVDVQYNRFEVGWNAWAEDEQSWGLAHVVIDGNVRDLEFWKKELTPVLQSKFKREDGAEMPLNFGLIDGGWMSEMLYLYTKWLAHAQTPGVFGKIRASKGEGKAGQPIIDRTWSRVAHNLHGHKIGTWEAKETINARLRLLPDDKGVFPPAYKHFNHLYGEEFFRQLCTGICTIDYDVVQGKMQEVKKFLNERKLKDEALDIEVGNLAAFRLRRWKFEAEEAKLLATIPKTDPKSDEPPPEKPLPKPANTFVGVSSWRV